MSKKILSLVLAVIMIFSTFVIATNAAVASGKIAGFIVETTAKEGMKAGEKVTISIYYDVAAAGTKLTYGNVSLAYSSEAYTIDTGSFAWGEFFDGTYALGTSTVSQTNTVLNGTTGILKLLNEADNAKASPAWDNGVQFQTTVQTGGAFTNQTGFEVTPGEPLLLCSIDFTVNRTLTATDVIGIPEGPVTKRVYLRAKQAGESKFTSLTAAAIDFSQAAPAPEAAAATPVVTVVGAQSKWAKGVPGKDYLFGYVGALANFTPVEGAETGIGGKNVENITSITATAKINGNTVTSPVYTIWQEGDVYNFRASFKGFDYLSTLAVEEMSFTVVTADGTFTSTNYAGTDTVNSIYEASVVKGLTAA